MNKIAGAVALLCLGSSAFAQSNVSIYGLLDTNVSYVNSADRDGGSQLKQSSGGMNTSRFGLRASEDLGNGLKAIMQLEGGIQLDNGASDGELFGRQANVGLQGDFGKVVMGRSFSTTYDFLVAFDPMGYSQQYSWATGATATGGRKDGMLTGVSNLVKYQYSGNGYKLGANYAFGETVGNTSAASKYGVAAALLEGSWAVVAAYENNNSALASNGAYDQAKDFHLAGSYDFGPAKIFAAYRGYKKTLATGGPDLRSDTMWAGANFPVGDNWLLTAAYYYQDIKNLPPGKDADPSMLVARAKYSLSKRTDLYAAMAYAKAKNGQFTSVSRDDAGFGSSQTGATMGIQHRF